MDLSMFIVSNQMEESIGAWMVNNCKNLQFSYLLQNKEIIWNTSRAFPPVRACLFSNGLTGITFLGDPSAGTGLPRGTMVYANMPIPFQVSIVLQIRESNYRIVFLFLSKNVYCRYSKEPSLLIVLEQDTVILAKYWFNHGRPVPA